jgi:predicted metal-dependent hydrolase
VSEARRLFNEHRFWEVHEVLEGLWKELKGSEKELVQGLILVAAALVHVQKDEWPPVWTMLADALRRLAGQPDSYYGWDVAKFRNRFEKILAQKKIEFPTV